MTILTRMKQVRPALRFVRQLNAAECLAARLQSYPTGEAVQDAFVKTLTGSPTLDEEERERQTTIKEVYESVHRYHRASHSTMEVRKFEIARKYTPRMFRVINGRNFFITKRGYMGVGPRSTWRGDKVAVFCGGKTAYVLRGSGDGKDVFQFLGEAYVHGMMNGEMFKEGYEIQKINIR
jgi:hypothetical protein